MNQPPQPSAEPETAPAGEAVPVLVPAIQPLAQGPSIVVRLLRVLKREPVLFITLAYLFVSFLGLWSSYWFYRRFDLPILEYMQSSDFFVAGLRRPEFVIWLGYVLATMWLSTWPLRWNEKNPERAQRYRDERWWGKWLFPEKRSWLSLWGARSESLLVFGFLILGIAILSNLNASRAIRIYKGVEGERITVTLADGSTLSEDSRLLGTSSAYVFLWWPGEKRTEVVPIESISRIQSLKPPRKPAADASTAAPR